jgi:hypothetical protein
MPLLTTVVNGVTRKLYVLHRISTQTVLNRNVLYPATPDDAPLEGFDPDLEYLAMDRDIVPDYDSRIFTLVTTEAKVGNLWRITFTTPRKVNDQIKLAVQNREATEVSKHMKEFERERLEIMALWVLFATQEGVSLTPLQTAIKNRVLAAAAKLLQNNQNAADKFAQIEANQVPDIDGGWAAE